ncbi:MAG: hypothetical protein AAF266_05555, partial [Planctomycetota bacterium]
MAAIPVEVEVSVYNVGLGDCLLLKFRTKASKRSRRLKERRMLIDFGSTGRNADGPSLEEVATQLLYDCPAKGGERPIDAIVATHRHRDHLAGFAGKAGQVLDKVLSATPPELVVMPWTENPEAEATPGGAADESDGLSLAQFVQSLRKGQEVTHSVMEELAAREAAPEDLGRSTDDELKLYGEKNLPEWSRSEADEVDPLNLTPDDFEEIVVESDQLAK